MLAGPLGHLTTERGDSPLWVIDTGSFGPVIQFGGCRCTEEEVAAGHRHRCQEGSPVYVAVGPWTGLTTEEIERSTPPAEPAEQLGDRPDHVGPVP